MSEIYTKIVGVTFSNENGELRQEVIESLEEFGSDQAFTQLRFEHQPEHPERRRKTTIADFWTSPASIRNIFAANWRQDCPLIEAWI